MRKKAEFHIGAIVGVLLLIIIFVGLIVLIVIIGQRADRDQNEIELNQTITFYVESLDTKTKKRIDAQYLISHEGIKLSEGSLTKDSLTEFQVLGKFSEYEIFCWGNRHYLLSSIKKLTPIEDETNISKVSCNLQPHSNLTIIHGGELGEGPKKVILNITSNDGEFRKLSVALKWSSGIINVKYKPKPLPCNEGSWVNYKTHLQSSGNETWHQRNFYSCNGVLEKCNKIDEINRCKLPDEEEVPNRYRTKVDKVIYTGINLKEGENIELSFEVTGRSDLNSRDYLEIIFYDKEMVYLGDRWEFLSELSGQNIGNPKDFSYKIFYEEN